MVLDALSPVLQRRAGGGGVGPDLRRPADPGAGSSADPGGGTESQRAVPSGRPGLRPLERQKAP